MTTLVTVLIVLAAILMILVVLVQKSKGGGLSSSFSSSNAVMGVRKTTDLLERITWGLAGFIIVMSILVVVITPKQVVGKASEIIIPNTAMPANAPADMTTPNAELPTLPSAPVQGAEQPQQPIPAE